MFSIDFPTFHTTHSSVVARYSETVIKVRRLMDPINIHKYFQIHLKVNIIHKLHKYCIVSYSSPNS